MTRRQLQAAVARADRLSIQQLLDDGPLRRQIAAASVAGLISRDGGHSSTRFVLTAAGRQLP